MVQIFIFNTTSDTHNVKNDQVLIDYLSSYVTFYLE